VILTQTRSDTPPKDADYLAQASQQGGGDTEKARAPAEPVAALVPKTRPASRRCRSRPARRHRSPRQQSRWWRPGDSRLRRSRPRADAAARDAAAQQPRTDRASLEMARLAAEIERHSEAYAKRPKRKFVSRQHRRSTSTPPTCAPGWPGSSASATSTTPTRRAGATSPAAGDDRGGAPRRQRSSASTSSSSSGYPLLDEAALRIVRWPNRSAAARDRERIEILHITRTWQFLPGNVLRNE
jgi:periplasmic protein TonB